MPRINIPQNPDELITLAKAIVAKHTEDGAASPLSGLEMPDMANKTTTADTHNKAAAKLYRDAEKATQDRELALGSNNPVKGTVLHYVRSVRDVLQGLNKGNEQKLGSWGFDVANSPRSSGGGETGSAGFVKPFSRSNQTSPG
jgi:hypothetical protein